MEILKERHLVDVITGQLQRGAAAFVGVFDIVGERGEAVDDLEEPGVAACSFNGVEAVQELVALVEVTDDQLASVIGKDADALVLHDAQQMRDVGVEAVEHRQEFGLLRQVLIFFLQQCPMPFTNGLFGRR